MPEFGYSTGSWGVKCTVTLPTDALVQMVEGRPTSSPADAKRIACLLACQRLYEAGALTDLLLLKSDENEYLLDTNTTIAPESSLSTSKGDEYAFFFAHDCRLSFYNFRFCVFSLITALQLRKMILQFMPNVEPIFHQVLCRTCQSWYCNL